MSSANLKPNPFQKLNPFQIQSSSQNYNNSFVPSYQQKPTYRSYEPAFQTFQTKQNTYFKNSKFNQDMWKFRDDNCNKMKGFNVNTNSMLNDKSLTQKNSFQKQLVLGSAVRKNFNHSQQQKQIRNQKIQNPFNRKYLVTGGKLAESYVYGSGSNVNQTAGYDPQITSYNRIKTDYQNLKYNNYISSQNQIPQSGVNYSLQNSLSRGQYQYSRKSIERHQSPKRDYHYNNQIGSRHSLQRNQNNNKVDSYNYLYAPSTQNIEKGNSRASKRSIGSRKSRDSYKQKQNQRIRFDQSDSDRQQSIGKYKNPSFGQRKQQAQQLKGPQTIILKGIRFYRQKIQKI